MDNSAIIKEILVQLFGFGIVFLILKKFAWGNLLGAIDARRKKIENDFAEIEKKKQDLDGLEKEYRKKLENIELEARTKIQEAANIGTQLARDIQEKARIDSQKMIDRAQAEISQDIAKARLSMRDDIVQISGLMTEKIMRQKLNAQEHERLVNDFLKDMEKIS